MATYDSYKDSGVKWLGQIPSHWEVKKLRSFLYPFSDRNHADKQLLSVTRDRGVIVRGAKGDDDNHNVIPEDLSGYKYVQPGDFIINKMKSWQGSYGVSDFEGIVSPAYFTYHLKIANRKFFSLALRSKAYIPFFMQFSKGIRVDQWDLTPDALKAIPFFLPPQKEQEAIVSYLDKVTADIDKAIEAQQKMIGALNERKQIIITRAVTRGLNPDAPLKDSGIDWLGQIPEHWEIRKIKFFARLKSGKNLTSEQISPEKQDNFFPVYGGNGLRGYFSKFNTSGDFAIIGRQGALCGNVNYANGQFWATDHAVVCYPLFDFRLLWFGETLKVANLNQYATQSAQPGLSVERVKNISLPSPPKDEMSDIANYIQKVISEFTPIITHCENMISLLQERKQIIINEVVTGKKKVI